MSRTRKKKYYRSRAISKSCRSHGGCPVCYGNKMHKHDKKTIPEKELQETAWGFLKEIRQEKAD